MLDYTAERNSCDRLCIYCYNHLLEDVFKFKRYEGETQTVREIVDEYRNDILLLRLDGHLTCAVKGKLLDIWDCSRKVVDCFWIVK